MLLLLSSGTGSAGAANLNSVLVLIPGDFWVYEAAPNQAEHKGKVHFRAALISITWIPQEYRAVTQGKKSCFVPAESLQCSIRRVSKMVPECCALGDFFSASLSASVLDRDKTSSLKII